MHIWEHDTLALMSLYHQLCPFSLDSIKTFKEEKREREKVKFSQNASKPVSPEKGYITCKVLQLNMKGGKREKEKENYMAS